MTRGDEAEIAQQIAALQAIDAGPVAPSEAQWRRHLERPADEAFVVINLLTLADAAELNRYAETAVPMVQALGAELIYMGQATAVMIGEEVDGCDVVSIWRWPSRVAWTQLWSNPDYAQIRPHFNRGVQRYRCIESRPLREA